MYSMVFSAWLHVTWSLETAVNKAIGNGCESVEFLFAQRQDMEDVLKICANISVLRLSTLSNERDKYGRRGSTAWTTKTSTK